MKIVNRNIYFNCEHRAHAYGNRCSSCWLMCYTSDYFYILTTFDRNNSRGTEETIDWFIEQMFKSYTEIIKKGI